MEYRATFKSMGGLALLLLFMALLFIGVGMLAEQFALIAVGLLFIVLLLAIRLRFSVVINDEEIVATGFFKTKRLRFDDITGAQWMSDYGYPKDRFYGPFAYEIRSAEETLRINFKLFPLDCMGEVLKRTEERTTGSSVP